MERDGEDEEDEPPGLAHQNQSRSLARRRLAVQTGAMRGLGILAMVLALSGCGEPERPPPVGSMGGAFNEPGSKTPRCREGTSASCTHYSQQANGVTSCWDGIKFCVDGKWTDCLDPATEPPVASD